MEIKDGGTTKWIASPQFEVKKGDMVETSFGMLMSDFESRSLKRTFKEIYFVTKAKVLTPAPASKPKDKFYTVSEILDNKTALTGKQVTFKARVTKYTPSIMQKNWLHVTDADGQKKNDLVVTTNDTTQNGDVVIIDGKLTVNKDLGSGYFFPVIIEDAKLTPVKD